jgi:hypothetical protein
MNKLFLLSFYFIPFSKSQEIISFTNVTLNQHNYLPWDYKNGRLYYHSNNKAYRCINSTTNCQTFSRRVPNFPTTYILETDFYFLNDANTERSCRYNYTGGGFCHTFSDNQYIAEYQSIAANDKYFYIKSANGLRIYDLAGWPYNPYLPIKTLPNFNTSWLVKEDGIYTAFVEAFNVDIMRYSPDGYVIEWGTSFPYCEIGDTPSDEPLLFASSQSKLYVLCTPVNLITIYDTEDGSMISQYAVDKGNAVSIECSSNFVFILYDDGSVVQYTLDFTYVYTYIVNSNMKTPPNHNTLKVDDNYLFYVLSSVEEISYIYQWSIQQSIQDISISQVHFDNSMKNTNISINQDRAYIMKKYILTSDSLSVNLDIQNSFFTPVTYMDEEEETHLIYFSGGGSVEKAVCGDVFVNDILITDLFREYDDNLNSDKLVSKYILAERRNFPLSDYAATLLKSGETHFYLIHGGISCDYETIYSEMFLIDIVKGEYIEVLQNEDIP